MRMLRAIVMASRLNFRLDPPIADAINRHRSLLATSAPPRLIEEYTNSSLRRGRADVPDPGGAPLTRSGDAGNPARRQEPGVVGRPCVT